MSERVQELMAGYVLDSLSPEEEQEFTSFVQAQPELELELAQLREVMGLIAYKCAAPAPPELRHRILAAVQPKTIEKPSFLRQLWQSRWQRRLGLAGVALLVMFLGVDNFLLRQKLTWMQVTVAALQNPETQLFNLQGRQSASQATGRVILDLDTGKAVIALQNLPALPSGDTYSLWAITAKKKILCGTFAPTADGQFVAKLPIPIGEYTSPVQVMQILRGAASAPADSNITIMTSSTRI